MSADLEGVAGVVAEPDVTPGTREWDTARRRMTAEINAAIAGAVEAGADDILVNDGHWMMRNVVIDQLRPEARLLQGNVRPLGMMEGIDQGWDAAIFLGYHSRFGVEGGVLGHTLSGECFRDIALNGHSASEARLNAAIAGAFGVPVVMVSGDAALDVDIREWSRGIEYVVTKRGVSTETAELVHPETVCRRIREGAARGVGRASSTPPCKLDLPCTVIVEFQRPSMAGIAAWVPTVERVDDQRVRFFASDAPQIMRTLKVFLRLTG